MSKVLVVDDDETQTKIIEKILSEKGYTVITTNEAADGLQLAMDQSPDLIILDVMMPIINGYNFCKLLKSEEGFTDIPIVLLTSRDDMEDVKIGMEMGADAYLTKPVNAAELFKAIDLVISKE